MRTIRLCLQSWPHCPWCHMGSKCQCCALCEEMARFDGFMGRLRWAIIQIRRGER